mmetsp:Transcript_69230/g.80766  ORF Transcript_69230/g.80766 Transcript_69230/m.80766 type:complete len:250 (-) Transcript_69230:69-818(-)
MPIIETKARLWFDTEEERAAYDDRMIANIELKSLDFDDENFSPVFSRATQETFLEPSQRYKSDFSEVLKPVKGLTFEQYLDKYVAIKPNHTFYREFTWEKFFSGFGVGYVFLRELPLRNFYARVLVMYIFAAKFLDHLKSPFPSLLIPQGQVVGAKDQWHHWDVRCYDIAWRATKFLELPNVGNKVPESKIWYGKQPGHMLHSDMKWPGHFYGHLTRATTEAHWDGTMNMPIHRLADPKHKDSYMLRYH